LIASRVERLVVEDRLLVGLRVALVVTWSWHLHCVWELLTLRIELDLLWNLLERGCW